MTVNMDQARDSSVHVDGHREKWGCEMRGSPHRRRGHSLLPRKRAGDTGNGQWPQVAEGSKEYVNSKV